MSTLPFRQVHLDFHTSPHIPGVGADFDPEAFVKTLALGHVNSVTVFAKCHHGYSYYPTQVGTPHPHLQRRDLLGEMIEAGHRAGLRVPVYTTVVWDELAWATHPEWRQLSPSGHIVGPSESPLKPGWKNLCMNTGYADYVIAQIEEILDRYEGDGLFIDITFNAERAVCVCATCLSQMEAEGINAADPAQRLQFTRRAVRNFMDRTTAAIRTKKPDQGIFYNSHLRMAADPALGNRPEIDNFTHLEIESLPGSGYWGYDHFPMYVRYYQTFDRELMMMTGRFHTTWGDFGGIRNRAALEFECFQGLAHGAICSIGDQLPPRGRLEPAVYQRIGEVYAEVERREPWCINTRPLPEIGVITTANPESEALISEVDRGVLHALEQLKYQFQYIDIRSDLSPYEVVILPDEVEVDAVLADNLRAYLKQGGRLFFSHRSGLDKNGDDFLLAEEMGVHYQGWAPFAPDYLLLSSELGQGIEPMPHVCEYTGSRVMAAPGAQVLARSGVPYFNRTWEHFCSHQYTPLEEASEDPVVVQNGPVIYLARPLFQEYANSGRRVHRQVIDNCLKRLLPRPRVGQHNLPSTAIVTVRQQEDDLLVHLLHYVHQRRGQQGLDIIEDRLPLNEVTLHIRTDKAPTAVQTVPEQEPLNWSWEEGYLRFTLPRLDGYQIVQIAGRAEG